MSSLVFFGAGASKPFGIPTMQEMVADFEDKLKNNNVLYAFYSRIKDVLIKEYGNSGVDIESMLSVFNGISTETKPGRLGHFLCYYVAKNCADGKFSTNELKLAKDLEQKLHDYIKDKCTVRAEQSEAYKISYLPLFQHMEGKKRNYDGIKLCRDWKAYTTNYDNIFEGFWHAFEPPNDHFEKSANSNKYVFNTTPLDTNHTLSKLHGSLDWTKEVSSGKIVRVEHTTYSPIETEGEIMLFPVQQKDLYLHPWFTLFQDLKTGLSNTQKWYVIGYAFNDEFLRNVFQESLVDNASKKLILINPAAEEIKSRFSDNIQNQIDVLPIRFGSKQFEIQLGEYVGNIKTIVVRFKTTDSITEHEIKIESNRTIKSATILSSNTGWDVFPVRDDMQKSDPQSACIRTIDQKYDAEVKLELKIDYNRTDEIKLSILYDAGMFDFTINYGDKTIAHSGNVTKKFRKIEDRTLELLHVGLGNAFFDD